MTAHLVRPANQRTSRSLPRDREQAPSPPASTYTLGSNQAEQERLRRQSAELHVHSLALLENVDLQAGQSAIDIGCGPCGVLELLSEPVGPGGRVIGLDADATHVALARAFADERGLTNVELLQGDARRTGLARSSFDLVHARLLLVNIPDATAVVSEMVRLATPGGWVAGQEADCLFLCHPPHPAHDRLSEVFRTIYEQDGADVHVGRRLPELYRAAGLVDVGIEAHAEVYPVGHSRRTILADLVRSMRAKIIERGVLTESELDKLDEAVRAHLGDPGTLTVPYLLFSVWGRKPADPASQGDS